MIWSYDVDFILFCILRDSSTCCLRQLLQELNVPFVQSRFLNRPVGRIRPRLTKLVRIELHDIAPEPTLSYRAVTRRRVMVDDAHLSDEADYAPLIRAPFYRPPRTIRAEKLISPVASTTSPLSSHSRKNIPLSFFQNSCFSIPVPPRLRDASRSSRTWRRDAVGVSMLQRGFPAQTNSSDAHGQVAWS